MCTCPDCHQDGLCWCLKPCTYRTQPCTWGQAMPRGWGTSHRSEHLAAALDLCCPQLQRGLWCWRTALTVPAAPGASTAGCADVPTPGIQTHSSQGSHGPRVLLLTVPSLAAGSSSILWEPQGSRGHHPTEMRTGGTDGNTASVALLPQLQVETTKIVSAISPCAVGNVEVQR